MKFYKQITISTHAPAGGATKVDSGDGEDTTHFYSRPCGRGDGEERWTTQRKNYFYSRPCERGDTRPRPARLACMRNFYSRPCERGDLFLSGKGGNGSISTHAPARGATNRHTLLYVPQGISTHAPARGATKFLLMLWT